MSLRLPPFKGATSVLSGATFPAAALSTFQLVTPHGLVFRPAGYCMESTPSETHAHHLLRIFL